MDPSSSSSDSKTELDQAELGCPFLNPTETFTVTAVLSSSTAVFKAEQLQKPITHIRVHSIFAGVTILLPSIAIVRAEGSNVVLFGSFEENVEEHKGESGSLEQGLRPVVIISSASVFGCVTVKKQ